MTCDIQCDEYQTTMQAAAASYLVRHRSQYLGNEHLLFTSTVHHLVANISVPLHMAEKLVSLASSNLEEVSQKQRLHLDLQASNQNVAVLVDPDLGKAWSVPVDVLYHYLAALPSLAPQPSVTP